MKVFYVRVTDSEFIKSDGMWTSPVFDLYDNSIYTNYSFTKADYGLDLLGDGTWTGMELLGPGVTESGYISDGKFVDTTGRIDIVSYTFDTTPLIDGLVTYSLNVFNTHVLDDEPTWTQPSSDVSPSDNVNLIGAARYAYFSLAISNPKDIALTGELLVRIEIDQPVIAPLYRRTRRLLDKFPEWMAMRELDNISATPELATPASVGGTFLNAAAGEWLEALSADLTYLDLQRYIESVDLNQVAWVYRKDRVDQFPWRVLGDDIKLGQASDLEEFYEADIDDDVYFWDEPNRTIYVRKPFTAITINEGEATPVGVEAHHVWNWLDDLGLFVDLDRLYLETNESFRLRILDVHINKPGVGLDNFKKTLRRELNIWAAYGATPDSSYLGATPEVLEISDIEQDATFITPEGLPTPKFIRLVQDLAEQYPTTWGNFYWNKAFWDLGGPLHEGYSTLPNRFDATPLLDDNTQSGVGYGDDLYVFRPDVVTGPRQFEATLRLRGRRRTYRTEYTAVEAVVEVYGQADRTIYNNPVTTAWLTLQLQTNEATPRDLFYSFEISNKSDASNTNPTGTSYSYTLFDIFDTDGLSRLDWKYQDGTPISDDATPMLVDTETVASLSVHDGFWDHETDTYTNTTTGNVYNAWFNNNPDDILTPASGPISMVDAIADPVILFKSTEYNPVSGKWVGPKHTYTLSLNGVQPDQTEQDVTLSLPEVLWHPELDTVPNKEYVLRLALRSEDSTPVPGVYALDDDDRKFFLSSSYLAVDGNNIWTDGEKYIAIPDLATPVAPDPIVFSTRDGEDYPITGTVWHLTEFTQTVPFSGVVDENGPWRNDVIPAEGNTNYNWKSVQLGRADFGMPADPDYFPSWIGVESNDNQVIVWLENNTIVPAHEFLEINYPPNAIAEFEEAGTYGFESCIIKARLRPDPGPEWNPQVHSGWFYDQQDEYYLYADHKRETFTGSEAILTSVAHQGAPIIVHTDEASPRLLRQVAFHDATPILRFDIVENIVGNGTDTLYLSYPDVYDLSVIEHDNLDPVAAPTSVASNVLTLSSASDKNKSYDVTYKLNGSFYADMNYNDNGEMKTRLVFNEPGTYVVDYESSLFNPATPVDVPLSPLYTSQEEGFIFISHNEYTLDSIEVHLASGRIIADGRDYMQVTVKSVDEYGNPKGDQEFGIATTFGNLDSDTIITDKDGFASVILASSETLPTESLEGTLSITGGVNATIDFEIEPPLPDVGRLMAIPSAEAIPADGVTKTYIFGKVEDEDFMPRAGVEVFYRKGRGTYEVFNSDFDGSVITRDDGTFELGPFTAAGADEPGYWFVALETDPDMPEDWVGDVVFWNEYPVSSRDDLNGLATMPIQMATPPSDIPPFVPRYQFPYDYDESATPLVAPPVLPTWLPPRWYALPWYIQYQLGLFGSVRNRLIYDYYLKAHRPRKEL